MNANNEKVTVCLRPQGNPNNCNTVCVSANAAQLLINNGSYYGKCLPGCAIPVQASTQVSNIGINEKPETAFDVKVLGNPSENHFNIMVNSSSNEKIKMRVVDISGRIVEQKENLSPSNVIKIGERYRVGVYFAEIKQGNNVVK